MDDVTYAFLDMRISARLSLGGKLVECYMAMDNNDYNVELQGPAMDGLDLDDPETVGLLQDGTEYLVSKHLFQLGQALAEHMHDDAEVSYVDRI